MLGPILSFLKLGGGYILAAVIVFGAGWQVRSWKADAQIQAILTDQAEVEAKQAKQALADIAAATKTINDAAQRYSSVQSTLSFQIADLKKELQNEKPLSPDCVPSPGRVRVLGSAIDAANKAAAAGHEAGRAMPAAEKAGR